MSIQHHIDSAITALEAEVDGIHKDLHEVADCSMRARELTDRLATLNRTKRELRQALGELGVRVVYS